MKPPSTRILPALLLAAFSLPAGSQSVVDEIAKYRQQLQDGNPAELWEARGEGLWRQARGPNA